LTTFEFNSFANNLKELDEDNESWLRTFIKPLIMIVLIGGTCWISYSSVKKKND